MTQNQLEFLNKFIKEHNIKLSHLATKLSIPRQNIADKLNPYHQANNFTSSQETALLAYLKTMNTELTELIEKLS